MESPMVEEPDISAAATAVVEEHGVRAIQVAVAATVECAMTNDMAGVARQRAILTRLQQLSDGGDPRFLPS